MGHNAARRLDIPSLDDDISAVYVIHDAGGNELFTFFHKTDAFGAKNDILREL